MQTADESRRKELARLIWQRRKLDKKNRLRDEMESILLNPGKGRWGKRAKRVPGDPGMTKTTLLRNQDGQALSERQAREQIEQFYSELFHSNVDPEPVPLHE
eukprot:3541729-Alexandrium_andersonii.AAC.1